MNTWFLQVQHLFLAKFSAGELFRYARKHSICSPPDTWRATCLRRKKHGCRLPEEKPTDRLEPPKKEGITVKYAPLLLFIRYQFPVQPAQKDWKRRNRTGKGGSRRVLVCGIPSKNEEEEQLSYRTLTALSENHRTENNTGDSPSGTACCEQNPIAD